MEIRVGYHIEIATTQPMPTLLLLDPHPSRDGDGVTTPKTAVRSLNDGIDFLTAE